MNSLRYVYAEKALSQIPRLLGNMDRNPFSPTYGCFHRDYWLDKTTDFPDAVRQFGVHSLALVYKEDFPNNIFRSKDKVRDWAIAGLDFWSKIQHKDGSFDEFYPFERGWVGPTAFTTFTSIEAFKILKNEISQLTEEKILVAIKKAAYSIIKGESEEDHLANHHAMACLAVWKAYELLQDEKLKIGFSKLWEGFKTYHNYNEGWSLEYDGVDPGYLSATVSFLGKIYQSNPDQEIFDVLKQSVEFASNFVYPNGFYAGSIGSRNTLHFYPHGFEILADKIPMAGAVAGKMLVALNEGKLVPPEIISDRYVFYRVSEFLQSYLDYTPRPENLPELPYEKNELKQYYTESKIYTRKVDNKYVIANLAKGGVVKIFNTESGELLYNDCGLIGELEDGSVVTSQWVDSSYICESNESGWTVSGQLNKVPSNKLFTPLKNIIFRIVLFFLGWSSSFSHFLKARIRKTLIIGQRKIAVSFKRQLIIRGSEISLSDELRLNKIIRFNKLSFGDEYFVRYVPQSRYFQSQELEITGDTLEVKEINIINKTKSYKREKILII